MKNLNIKTRTNVHCCSSNKINIRMETRKSPVLTRLDSRVRVCVVIPRNVFLTFNKIENNYTRLLIRK